MNIRFFKQTKPWVVVCIVGATTLLTLAALIHMSDAPLSIALSGGCLCLAAVFPSFAYAVSGRFEQTPILPVIGIFYGIFFALPVFLVPLAWPGYDALLLYNRITITSPQSDIIWLVTGGLCCMWGTYYLAMRFRPQNAGGLIVPCISDKTAQMALFYALVLLHQAHRIFPEYLDKASLSQFFEPAAYVGFGGVYFLWRQRQLKLVQIAPLFLFFLPVEIYLRIRILFLTDILFLCLFGIFALWHCRQFKLLILLILISGILMTGYGATGPFRSGVTHGLEKVIRSGAIYYDLVIAGKSELSEEKYTLEKYNIGGEGLLLSEGKFGGLVKRISQIWMLHAVANVTPHKIPFWQGTTYTPLITALVPRVIFPDKPHDRAGAEFGKRYNFLSQNETKTSVNLPWITELYANFGVLGIFLGMGFFGLFLAGMSVLVNGQNMSTVEKVTALALFFPLVYQESNFSVMVGTLPLKYAAFLLYFYIGSKVIVFLTPLRWTNS